MRRQENLKMKNDWSEIEFGVKFSKGIYWIQQFAQLTNNPRRNADENGYKCVLMFFFLFRAV